MTVIAKVKKAYKSLSEKQLVFVLKCYSIFQLWSLKSSLIDLAELSPTS